MGGGGGVACVCVCVYERETKNVGNATEVQFSFF